MWQCICEMSFFNILLFFSFLFFYLVLVKWGFPALAECMLESLFLYLVTKLSYVNSCCAVRTGNLDVWKSYSNNVT